MTTQRNPAICLPMETKVRDLDARLYLACRFLERGFDCIVGSKRGVHDAMFKSGRPFVFVDKGGPAGAATKHFYDNMNASGGAVVRLDEEGGVYERGSTVLLARNNAFTLRASLVTCLWGEAQYEDLLRARPDAPRAKIVVTGNPRFDLRKPRFQPFYRAVSSTVPKDREFIVFNMAFQTANHKLDLQQQIQTRRRILGTHFDEDKKELVYCYQKVVLHRFVNAVRRLRREFPDLLIVVRPHPVENAEFYRRSFRGVPDVRVTNEGSAQEWMVAARAVIQHTCTTAIEAFVSGIPVVSYLPIFEENFAKQLPRQVADNVTEEDGLVAWVRTALAGEAVLTDDERARRLALIKPTIANLDFDASSRIADEVCGRLAALTPVDPAESPVRRRLVRRIRRKGILMRAGRACGYRGVFSHERMTRAKFPSLAQAEVESRLDLFRRIEPGLPAATVTAVEPNTYLVQANR